MIIKNINIHLHNTMTQEGRALQLQATLVWNVTQISWSQWHNSQLWYQLLAGCYEYLKVLSISDEKLITADTLSDQL